MMVRTLTAVVAALLALPGLARADQHTDEEMNPLTWVRFFTVEPGHGKDFMDMMMSMNAETFDGLMEDGAILGWGVFVPFTVNAEEHWTHGLWVTAKDWGHMDKFMAGMEAADSKMSEVEQEHAMRKFLEMVDVEEIHDVISRDVASTHAAMEKMPEGKPTYMRMGFYKVKPGHMEQAIGMYRDYALPTLEKLQKKGIIFAAGLSAPEVVSSNDWSLMSWSMIANLGAMDKSDAAFEAANEKRSEAERESMMERFMEHFDWDSYHSKIIRIVHMGGQDQGKEKQATNKKTGESAAEHHAAKD
jgi:hypothetical protein